ncbi:methionyl-tRNA formyltransferase [Alkalibacter rhizosphaerae]|uniref:Methionyl-tRNA formyltransferase n=1 Tax=Alkalibacter rhizosphaerae TaxID=2815577 RepID=A0A974XF72_9FIRM|nr:methionyl-tRNA formyltransferase [Alkalibacter rhizosphaerae]QSX08747.1 methionyl-tRNA formyltransferase [Alkalibacter rhizosphaerae]
MKVVFMGTPVFAVETLKQLLRSDIEVAMVLTQPDKPNKRGKKIAYSPVKELALSEGIPVMQPTDLKDPQLLAALEDLETDYFVVVAYGRVLPEAMLQIPRYGSINVHASLLPKYRGAAPIHWAVLNGEKESGVTTMLMDEGLDTGDILLQRSIAIPDAMTTGELHDALAVIGAELLLETLFKFKNSEITPLPQVDEDATISPMIYRETGRVDWKDPAKKIHDQIRGTTPYPGAFTTMGEQRIKLFSSELMDEEAVGEPGEIVAMDPSGIVVQTGRGTLLIREIQVPGKKRLPVAEYLKGHDAWTGTALGH